MNFSHSFLGLFILISLSSCLQVDQAAKSYCEKKYLKDLKKNDPKTPPLGPKTILEEKPKCELDPRKIVTETNEDKAFVAMGYLLGEGLRKLDLSDKDIASLYKGVYLSAKNLKPDIDVTKYQGQIPDLFKNRMENLSKKESEKGLKYKEKFLNEEGGQELSSGLSYKVLKEGSGVTPKLDDIVEIHLEGKLVSGVVFDSTLEQNRPRIIPVNSGTKGWIEALLTMKEGGKYKFVIPPDLAHGTEGLSPHIPGSATLIYEVELLKISKSDTANK